MMEPTAQQEGERIEQLLAELQGACGPGAWAMVEELVHRIVQLYGNGLRRVLETVGSEREAELFSDELLSSLFLLHGLHPQSTEERVRIAVARVESSLSSRTRSVRLLAVSEDEVHLEVDFREGAEGRARQGLESAIQRMVEEAAPEVQAVRISDKREALARAGLVALRTPGGGLT